jgi:hypothetical protein
VSSHTKENGGSPLSSAQIRHKALDEITTPETAYLADYLEQHKHEIIERWRKAAENEPAQAERLAKMDDGELLDHLPALTEAVIGVLRGEKESLVEEDARLHGHQRRLDGYSVMDLLWELTTFRRVFLALLDEASDEIPDWIPVSGSRTILDLLDVCARVSIDQHVKETEQERDAAASRADTLETQRQRFLGSLSHELRNQIQPILLGLLRLKKSDRRHSRRKGEAGYWHGSTASTIGAIGRRMRPAKSQQSKRDPGKSGNCLKSPAAHDWLRAGKRAMCVSSGLQPLAKVLDTGV